jgi:Tfp pilus assembly protein PilX
MAEENHVISEKGAALIISLLLLLVLTVLALSLINTSTFEIGISGNEKTRLEAFYAAEAGIQMALSQLPNMEAIPRTTIGSDSQYWSGSGRDRSNPTRLESLGLAFQYGSDLSQFAYRRIGIHVTGESEGAVRELEVQVKGNRPISPTTEY